MTDSQVHNLSQLILLYDDVFSLHAQEQECGEVDGITHVVNTDNHPPINQLPQRVPFAQCKEMSKLVNEMLHNNVIEDSSSPWSSPVVLVKKKNGQLRFCVDYRCLNAITWKDVFPMPRIDDILDHLSNKQFFSTLDAKSGYWQVQMDESSKKKTAFHASNGLYQFRVMSFGFCNTPATFKRVIQHILVGLDGSSPFCCAYTDDILVFSDTLEQHTIHLQQVFECLQSAGLLLHAKKCMFTGTFATYLGHIISCNGLHPDSTKITAVRDFPIPTTVKGCLSISRINQLL